MTARGDSRAALSPRAQAVVDTYLAAVDAEPAGVIQGLYLVGSLALGDFRPRTSDVDFVAVTAARPDATVVAAFERAHQRLRARHRRPHVDGLYVTWEHLASDPGHAIQLPHSLNGRFDATGGAGDPVTWHTCGVSRTSPRRCALLAGSIGAEGLVPRQPGSLLAAATRSRRCHGEPLEPRCPHTVRRGLGRTGREPHSLHAGDWRDLLQRCGRPIRA